LHSQETDIQTALAWANTANPNHIEIIRNWPTCGALVGTQAPSEVSYPNEGDTSTYTWGYDINPQSKKVVVVIDWLGRDVLIMQTRSNGLSLD
jgi:hypothetical protein